MSNIPKLRFPEFTDAWEKCKLGEVARFSKGSGYSKNDLVEHGKPIILYGRLYTNYQTIIDEIDTFTVEKNKSVISEGNEVLIPASGESAEEIARASAIEKSGIILGGDLNIIKILTKLSPHFLAITLSNGNQKLELSKKAQGKSVVHLRNSDLETVVLLHPTLPEQQKIGTLFRRLDRLITLHKRKWDDVILLKKALLQKMFPKNGSDFPEIRFPEFTDAWEKCKLGEIFEQTTKYVNPTEQGLELWSLTVENGLTPKTERYNREFLVKKDDKYKLVENNEFIYNPMNLTLGAIALNETGKKVCVSGYYITMIAHQDKYHNSYLIAWLKSYQAIQLYKNNATGSLKEKQRVQFPTFSNISAYFPINLEQQKIGNLFKQLDRLITLHKRQHEHYQLLKKALLQQMFV
ncbi:restriction endonuclease subunit S [Gallibacterium anatis]|uniref:restriction endonuclease subunit S n=1 Tax=Gallibacterium anatis TaxID=750 RepID=UPI003003C073